MRDDRRAVPAGPEIPDDVTIGELDREARANLRSLSKQNAETVGRHLVMVARLFDVDPELAYQHAVAAVARGGRVDIVRETAGLAAYRTERYAEALRELRTVRRLNGSSEHLPVMADCERGLGRPERAIALAQTPEVETLDIEARVELSIVVAGARMDLGETEAALVTLDDIDLTGVPRLQQVRVLQARADILESVGRDEEAAAVLAGVTPAELAAAIGEVEIDEDVIVVDLDDLVPDEDEEDDEDANGAEESDATGGDPLDESADTPAAEDGDLDDAASADADADADADAHADANTAATEEERA
ncbi:hypothetical protein [Sanguibacter massiliensis]|uniref:hypothetical protein n=1 Tax=Sanguibacter massiliensis TaxID=1973217 RepID=UPI00101AEBCC|nr:hypothetical protein [Sanguibacter massiliensis]